ncbi:MAG TPA: isochorismatase family protein [Stellaceae bacterium]|nr:isochorismatase family protein [Stellaceae bacterium]
MRSRMGCIAAAALAVAFLSSPALAQQTIIDEWPTVKAPPAPELKTVNVNAKTTALLMLDFVKQTCNMERRPRCIASLPIAKQLLAAARASNVFVVYSLIPNGVIGDVLPDVAPLGSEPYVQASIDKFFKTDLEKILKDRGIETVIVTGTAAHGAVMYTGSEAVVRGFKVIVPVDAVSADNAFIEQYVAYNFTSAPSVAAATTLTRASMIKF